MPAGLLAWVPVRVPVLCSLAVVLAILLIAIAVSLAFRKPVTETETPEHVAATRPE